MTPLFLDKVPGKTQCGKTGVADLRVSLLCRNSEYKCVIVSVNQSLEEFWWEKAEWDNSHITIWVLTLFYAMTTSLLLLLLCLLLYETRVLLPSRNVLLTLDEPSVAPPTEIETSSASLCWPSVTVARVTLHWCFGSSLTPLHALSMLQKFSLLEISPSPLYKWESLQFFLSLKKSNSWFFLCLMCFSIGPSPYFLYSFVEPSTAKIKS